MGATLEASAEDEHRYQDETCVNVCQSVADRDPHAGVVVVFADLLDRDRPEVVGEPVVEVDGEHGTDELEDAVAVVVEVERLDIDVTRGAPCVERGEQYPALEHERVVVVGRHQPRQEAFEGVERHQLVRRTATCAGESLEVAVAISADVGHSKTSRSLRSDLSAFGNRSATCSNVDGWLPGRWTHVRSAPLAISWPWRCRSRYASTMLRGAS